MLEEKTFMQPSADITVITNAFKSGLKSEISSFYLEYFDLTWIWRTLYRSGTCPECRTACTITDIFRIFFTFDSETTGTALNAKIDNVELELGNKLEGMKVDASEEICALKDQQAQLIKDIEEKTKAMLLTIYQQFERKLEAEQEYNDKLQKQIILIKKKQVSQCFARDQMKYWLKIFVPCFLAIIVGVIVIMR